MTEKIYDIIPPGESSGIVEEKEEKKKPSLAKKVFLVPLFFLLLLGGLFYFTTEPKAVITIRPETERVDFKANLTVDASKNNVDFNERIIPGKIIEAEKTVSQEFSSSGKSFKKAEGVIRLFNKFATWPETWAEGTRFISGDGKLFKSKSKIHVPPAVQEGSKKSASFVDVEVVAAEAGEEYNIDPTQFSIYVYRGTARYSYYWGESYESMSGGGETLKVTKEDLEKAERALSEKSISESKASLVSKAEGKGIILDQLIESEVIEFSPLAEINQEIDSFMAQAKAESRTVIFKREDLEKFVNLYALNEIGENKEIFKDSVEIEYSPTFLSENRDEKIEDGSILLNLDFSVHTYNKIDSDFLKRKLLGKDEPEVKSIIFNNFSEIKESGVEISPFWARKTPLDINQIEIVIENKN